MNMKYIHDIDTKDSLKTLVIQDLKERGIKIPKQKSKDIVNKENEYVLFGSPLHCLPAHYIEDCGYVPKFLIEAVELIEKYLECEGLFRKTGSVTRQKELKKKINDGESVEDANVYDLTSLVKQFFRDLPDPLLTCRLHGAFIQAYQMEDEEARVNTILSLCLLLPWEHLSTLRYIMLFLARVASRSSENKMDVTNLAVVLTPNLMNVNNRSEKMSLTEGRLLQVQTMIVEMMIVYADKIGLVSDIMNEKSALSAPCFTSEDELEKDGNEDKPKKKKRRSGSLQGLISGINQSLSKWRANSGHNTSKNINDSISTVDSSTLSDNTEGGFIVQEPVLSITDATPKLMRKRKADEDMAPFSATKKMAILQQMPAMSALGNTPFTPASTMRPRRDNQDFTLGTPNIQFSEDNYVVFNGHGREPRPQNTPSVKPLLLPVGSAYKSKKQTAIKGGCFSPKSAAVVTMGGKKKTVKGFLRRLSGGKEQPLPANGTRESPDVALRLSFTDEDTALYTESDTPSRKKWGLFRKHKKTPSSPARLLGPGCNLSLLSQQSQTQNQPCEADTSNASHRPKTAECAVVDLDDHAGVSISEKALARQLERDLLDSVAGRTSQARGPHRRGFSSDSSHAASKALKRGKPNTLGSGLPLTKQRRSLDSTEAFVVSVDKFRKTEEHTNEDSTFTESVNQKSFSVKSAPETECSSLEDDHIEALETSFSEEKNNLPKSEAEHKAGVLIQSDSKGSIFQCSSGSSLNISPDQSMRSEVIPAEEVTNALEPLDVSGCSRLSSNTSQVTVIDMRQVEIPLSNKQQLVEQEKSPSCAEQNESSILSKGQKISLERRKKTNTKTEAAVARSKSFHGDRKPVLLDIDEAAQLTRQSSVRESNSNQIALRKKRAIHHGPAEPTLTISSETHSILSRAGIVGKKSKYSKGAYVAVQSAASTEMVTKETAHNSIGDLKSSNAGGVAKNVSRFNEITSTAQELAEKHASPLRFPKSALRTRGTSPLRIPSIFAKGDKEAAKFREMAMNSTLVQHKSSLSRPVSKGKPCLPISTTMVRNPCVEQAIHEYHNRVAEINAAKNKNQSIKSYSESADSQLNSDTKNCDIAKDRNLSPKESTDISTIESKCNNVSIGLESPSLKDATISQSLLATIDNVCTPKNERVFRNTNVEALKNFAKRLSGSPEVSDKMQSLQLMTPKIKPSILPQEDVKKALLQKTPGQPMVARKSTSISTETPAKCRSPVKPLKRLQGSPSSPRSPGKYPTSPRKPLKLCRKQGFSPIPAHIKEFNL